MPLADFNSAILAVSPLDPTQIILTISIFIAMISLVSICTCCGNVKENRKDQDDCDYGVVAVTATSIPNKPLPIHTVNFRESTLKRPTERHSQPVSNTNASSFNRQSAPGRALPKLPADMYTAIDKKPKTDDIRFVDEVINPMYECIDAETDSFVDPLYSKVGAPGVSAVKDRKYDYPIFPGRQNTRNQTEELLYQSASQIYVAGSEDPYSSITSERERNLTFGEEDGDTSSAYDPGYAKVNPAMKVLGGEDKTKRIEKTERELDLLYSKIRRNAPTYNEENNPGPSRIDVILPQYPLADPMPPMATFDEQSAVSSREPSYRYITMRENADIVRERLRQQGQLDRPIREHYYSTIGNDYETINNGSNQQSVLNIETHENPRGSDVPPPPTSPIPDRSRPVSYIEGSSNGLGTSTIPPPPDLRCSPVPPRPICDEHQHTFSILNAKSSQDSVQRNTFYENDHNSNKPSSSNYRSLETLIGRRTVEEKETVVEKRSMYLSGVQIPSTSNSDNIMSRSMDNSLISSKPIYEVKIQKLDKNYDGGPGVDEIISGRRYRSGQVTDDQRNEVAVDNEADNQNKSASKSEKDHDPSGNVESSSLKTLKFSKNKFLKDESEDEKIKRLGTIYTANDYISQMDMSDEKPWPINSRRN